MDGIVSPAHQPRISVVTPSYNQARFLEACLRSVLGQKYPNLEYIVIDGGSTDGSVEIIKNFERDLAYWVSEPDAGHYDGLNKGFRRATGDILAWLNSDDMYTPWAFAVVADIFERLPEVQWLSTLYPLFWNEADAATHCTQLPGFDRRAVLGRGMGVQQESTFWRRSLWERAGGALDASFKLAGDLDLWARFWEHAELYGVAVPLGGIRRHGGQRHVRHFDDYMAEAAVIAGRYGLRCSRRAPAPMLSKLRSVMAAAVPRRLRPAICRVGFYRSGRVVQQRTRDGVWNVRRVFFP
ncbi:MAG TPA: glycosyltransferase family 2 protein [Methylomirabilota bacterium]